MVTPISKHHINNKINNEKENHCLLKSYYKKNGHLIIIENNWNDDIIYHNVIDYLHDEFQLTKNNENILLSWNGWLKKSTFNYCDANIIY